MRKVEKQIKGIESYEWQSFGSSRWGERKESKRRVRERRDGG